MFNRLNKLIESGVETSFYVGPAALNYYENGFTDGIPTIDFRNKDHNTFFLDDEVIKKVREFIYE